MLKQLELQGFVSRDRCFDAEREVPERLVTIKDGKVGRSKSAFCRGDHPMFEELDEVEALIGKGNQQFLITIVLVGQS